MLNSKQCSSLSSRKIRRLGVRPWLAIGISATVWNGIEWIAPTEAIAQIAGDGSLGTLVNGSLTDSCASAQCTITGGTLNDASSTLLHSFDQFTSSEGAPAQSALFVDPGVRDIIVRVTGGNQSFINNFLRTSEGSTANLFFINPSGITFGANAQLDLGGSFVASTANEIVFANGVSLATGKTDTPGNELLTVSTPVGLGFLPDASAPIRVQGTGNRLTFGSPEAPNSQFVNRIFQQSLPPGAPFPPLPPISELFVRPGQTISLVGNGVELAGGNLTAAGGQIGIGSVASGIARLNSDLSLDYDQISQFSDILLADRATLEASAPASGAIRLSGKDIRVQDGSAVLAETLPAGAPLPPSATSSGGLIEIDATGIAQVAGFVTDPAVPFNPPFFSYLSVDVAPGASGSGGKLDLQARELAVENGGQIGASTYGEGAGGRLSIAVEEVTRLTGGSLLGPSGLFASADSIGSGSSGQISVETGRLQMSGGAQIFASSFTPESAGGIAVAADQITLTGASEPIETSTPEGPLQRVIPTRIESSMGISSVGTGENIDLVANQILISDGARVVTTTAGTGDAGSIDVVSDEIVVSGLTPLGQEGPSLISTLVAPGATGKGGALNIEADSLQVLGSAQVGTSTAGQGGAGDLSVNSRSILISGQSELGRSGLFANAVSPPNADSSTGAGGNLFVQTDTLRITDGGTLNVSNFPSGRGGPQQIGRGDAGNLTVEARQIFLDGEGVISADTAEGDRGNITLQTETLTLRRGSRISANATGTSTGGNIEINAPEGFIVAVPEENSDITANAVLGDGGRVDITAQNVLGIEPRPELTPLSDITTSSEAGIEGETQVERLNTELQTENTPLPQSTEVLQVAQGCSVSSTDSSFVQSGRGGLIRDPYGVLNSRDSLADISLPSAFSESITETMDSHAERTAPNVIAEAQGWATNAEGDIVLLTAESSEVEKCLNWQS